MSARIFNTTFYAGIGLLTVCALGYPFLIAELNSHAAPHAAYAPLLALIIGVLAITGVALDMRRGILNGASIAVLGIFSALAGVLRLFDLPAGGNAMFFLVIVVAAALGPRFGLLLGVCSMAVGAVFTGGIGPWLPFQMLALGCVGALAGGVGIAVARWNPRARIAALVVVGWTSAFMYGAVMNLWFWPIQRDGGALSWSPSLGLAGTIHRYAAFYAVTSFVWDAAGAFANALLIAVLGQPIMDALARLQPRLRPNVTFVTTDEVILNELDGETVKQSLLPQS